MTYDPQAFGPNAGDELPVLVGPSADEAPELFLLRRPERGVVRVRVWAGAEWGAPVEREMDAAALADDLEQRIARAERAGRTVTQSAYAVRLWLTGQGPGGSRR